MAVPLDVERQLLGIGKTRTLQSASSLLKEADRLELLDTVRDSPLRIGVEKSEVVLQSQRLLIEKNVDWEVGWGISRFVSHLNSFVFFWPGSESGPIRNGKGHATSKDGPQSAITLRIRTDKLFETNAPLFCRFNSGAPRMTPVEGQARRSPRGGRTFLPMIDFTSAHSEVVEVVFEHKVMIPDASQYRTAFEDSWHTI